MIGSRLAARLFISLLLSVLLAVCLTACTQPVDGVLRFGLSTAPVSLDPRFATDAVSYRITRLLYRSLVDFDQSFSPVPDLADWQILSPRRYRFSLHKHRAEFHNGARLTAADVKASYDSVLSADSLSPHKSSLDMIAEIQVLDEDRVDFILSRDDPLFVGRLVLGILPAELIAQAHDFARQPVGSGVFRFHAWPQEGQLQLQRIRDGMMLEFVHVAEDTVRVMKLLRGEIDIIQGDISQELVGWLQDRQQVRIDYQTGDTFSYLGFNLTDPVVGSIAVRQAIAHAIDRDAIINYVMGKRARKASAILVPTHWAGNPELSPIAYDPGRARDLLRQAGYDQARPLSISYKTSSNPFRLRLATVIQYQLKQVGIDLQIQSYDWGTFYSDIKEGRFQMYSLSWVGLKLPDIFRYVYHSSSIPPQGANRGRYNNPEVDRLIEQAESSSDQAQQALIYARLQALLLEDLPYVPLWYEDLVLVSGLGIHQYTLATDGNYDGLEQVIKTRP